MSKMDQMQRSYYQKATIVITGDLEDWKYVFRELKMRVGVSFPPMKILTKKKMKKLKR